MGDEEDRKLFVGGLPQEASQDDLQVFVYEFVFHTSKKFAELKMFITKVL